MKQPEELKLVLNGEDMRVLIDDIEIPFVCDIKINNNIEVNRPGPREIMTGRSRSDVRYLQGPAEIVVTIRPQQITVINEDGDKNG